MIFNRLHQVIETEKNSRAYAEHYYEIENGLEKLYTLDTMILEKILAKGGKLFDATMGRARHLIHFAKKGFDVTGNDYNPYMVNVVRKELKNKKLKATLLNLDITNLKKIKNNTFDYTISMHASIGCIPRKENRQKALNELARVTKPSGLLVIHVYNMLGDLCSLKSISWALKDYILLPLLSKDLEIGDTLYPHGLIKETFNHIYTPFELKKSFKKANLSILKEIYLTADYNIYKNKHLETIKSDSFILVGKKSKQ